MTQTTNGYDDELNGGEETDAVPDSQEFESYYDPGSGSWSLRIVPSTPPPVAED